MLPDNFADQTAEEQAASLGRLVDSRMSAALALVLLKADSTTILHPKRPGFLYRGLGAYLYLNTYIIIYLHTPVLPFPHPVPTGRRETKVLFPKAVFMVLHQILWQKSHKREVLSCVPLC